MIIKVTKSGKAFMVIDDEGNAFITSMQWLNGLLQGKSKQGFVLMTKMPNKIASDRFKNSPTLVDGVKVDITNDALSPKVLKGKENKKQFEDKKVW